MSVKISELSEKTSVNDGDYIPVAESAATKKLAYSTLKSLISTFIANTLLSDMYTGTQATSALANKADKATTLAGYGITNAYTKTESDNKYLTEHQSLSGYATESWVTGQGYLTAHQDISGKQDKSNLVTSLSASSTDAQYPSAKCVYDALGDIETLLAAL